MKSHILRSPHTDRYEIRIPDRFSDLTDDTRDSSVLLLDCLFQYPPNATPDGPNYSPVVGFDPEAPPLGPPSGSPAGAATNPLVYTNDGFTLPGSGFLAFLTPASGVYSVELEVRWFSSLDSTPMTGRSLTTYANTSISAALLVQGAVRPGLSAGMQSFTVGLDNKLGPMMDSSDSTVLVAYSSGIVSLTEGQLLQPAGYCAGDPNNARLHGGLGVGFYGAMRLQITRLV